MSIVSSVQGRCGLDIAFYGLVAAGATLVLIATDMVFWLNSALRATTTAGVAAELKHR